jgi:hypothetical protein
MPPNVVKTPADEKKWNEAKEIVKKQYPKRDERNLFGLINHIYQNMKK